MDRTDEYLKRVVRAVRAVVGDAARVPLHAPFIERADWEMVAWTAEHDTVGYKAINRFEEELAIACGRRFCIAVSSGTAALHLALVAVGVKPMDQVEMPSLNFVAAAAAVRYCGAFPVFGYGVVPEPAARIGVHLLGELESWLVGQPQNWQIIGDHTPVIEDAAEALGSTYNGKPAGSFGDISILSFNNNKIITTGGGGAVLTDSPTLAETVRHLATTAKKPSPFFFDHTAVGFNYRMSNIAAALGLSQLLRLRKIVSEKRAIEERYVEAFKAEGFGEPSFGHRLEGASPNRWLMELITDGAPVRDAVLKALHEAGIGARALFTPLHLQEPYKGSRYDPATIAAAEARFSQAVCLPSGRFA